MTTNFSICQDCESCVGQQPVETVEKDTKKTLAEKTKDALSEDQDSNYKGDKKC